MHAIVYPPRNPDFAAPDGELPPFVAFVHGGPTAHASPAVNPAFAYYTSRGIGVVDVNYGGSSGYGREYRERLRGSGASSTSRTRRGRRTGLADPGSPTAPAGDRGRFAGGWTVSPR